MTNDEIRMNFETRMAKSEPHARISMHPPSLTSPAPSPCEARAGRGLGRGNRARVWEWYQDALAPPCPGILRHSSFGFDSSFVIRHSSLVILPAHPHRSSKQ